MEQRGWTPVAISMKNYLRLEKRLEHRKQPWDDVIGKILDKLERYERAEAVTATAVTDAGQH